MIATPIPRFRLGHVVATPAAIEALERAGVSALSLVSRHAACDWGECDSHDRQVNEDALSNGDRIFSVYVLPTGDRLWVITEADRSSTCLLQPNDY